MRALPLKSRDEQSFIGLLDVYIDLLPDLYLTDIVDRKIIDLRDIEPVLIERIEYPCYISGVIDVMIMVKLLIVCILRDNRLRALEILEL